MPAPKPAATTANCSRPVTGLYEPGARFDQLVRPQGVQCVPSENVVLCVALGLRTPADVHDTVGCPRYLSRSSRWSQRQTVGSARARQHSARSLTGWVLVAGAAVLSTIAGATILTTKESGNLPAWLAMGSAVLTVIHKGWTVTSTRPSADTSDRHATRSPAAIGPYRSSTNLPSCRVHSAISMHRRPACAEVKVTPPGWVLRRAEKLVRRAIAMLEPTPGPAPCGAVGPEAPGDIAGGVAEIRWDGATDSRRTPPLAGVTAPFRPPAPPPASTRSPGPLPDSASQHPKP